MATVGGGIRLLQAAAGSRSTPGNAYTPSASNTFGIVNISVTNASGSTTVSVAGITVFATSTVSGNAVPLGVFYIGPGQAVAIGGTSGNSIAVTGVEYVNA